MSLPLIATKFILPAIASKNIRRPRLLQRLDESLDEKIRLVLVCAPAGYGKTTLVSEWLQSPQIPNPNPFAWLTLEPGDDDLTRFLTYFIATVQRMNPGFGASVLSLLLTHKPPPVITLATLLVNEFNEIPGLFFLVLDDYHLTPSKPVQDFIAFLVDHQPAQLRLVLITRTDPALPLARLRARGQLVEIRQDDLCFQPKEATEYLSQALSPMLPDEQAAFLIKQTEGWITGLQLASLSLREAKDPARWIQAFSGEHEFIADYLTEEVLVRLPEPIRNFLLQTSILERLTAPLCTAVTGQPEAQAILKQLCTDHLFTVSLDSVGAHTWFRYHILFAELLRKRLYATQGESVRQLHDRASRWFEENGLPDLAVEHAIAGKDYERASQLIVPVAESLLMSGHVTTLLRWLESLPEEERLARLGVLYGLSLILCGRPVNTVLPIMEKMQERGGAGDYPGEWNLLLALVAILQGDARRAIQLSEQSLAQLPPTQGFFCSMAADTLGMGNTLAGDIPAATQAFERVVDISLRSGNFMMAIMALTNLAGLQYLHGSLRAGIATCRQALELANTHIGGKVPLMGRTLLNLGEILREQGDLEAAYQSLSEAAHLMEEFSEVGPAMAHLSLARLMMNKKDWPAAQCSIEQARQFAQVSQPAKMASELVENVQTLQWIKNGDLAEATQWAREFQLFEHPSAELFTEAGIKAGYNEFFQSKVILFIRLYLALAQPESAGQLVDWLTEANEKHDRRHREVELLVLKALACQQMNQTKWAVETLAKALVLGEVEGYFMTFVDEGEPLQVLLYAALQQKVTPSYTSRLLDAVSHQAEASKKTEPARELIEPLSEREIEVLHLIAAGCSNAEIARQLYISMSTVKGHTSNILGKLGVKNRTEAVARARRLNLINTT